MNEASCPDILKLNSEPIRLLAECPKCGKYMIYRNGMYVCEKCYTETLNITVYGVTK